MSVSPVDTSGCARGVVTDWADGFWADGQKNDDDDNGTTHLLGSASAICRVGSFFIHWDWFGLLLLYLRIHQVIHFKLAHAALDRQPGWRP